MARLRLTKRVSLGWMFDYAASKGQAFKGDQGICHSKTVDAHRGWIYIDSLIQHVYIQYITHSSTIKGLLVYHENNIKRSSAFRDSC